jgi:hypothetical protein
MFNSAPIFDFIEPIDVHDVFVNGMARVEPLNGGLIRIWLYADEGLAERLKVIRCKLVLPLPIALEISAEYDATIKAIHRQTNPLRLVT